MPRQILQVRVNLPQEFRNGNNNNAENRYALARNQLYRIAFLRFTLMYGRVLTETQRKIFEFIVLCMALFSFISLIYIHIVFVQSPILCLEKYHKEWENAKILRLELLRKKENASYSLYDSYYKEHATRLVEAGLKPCPKLQHFPTNEDTLTKNGSIEELSYKEESLDVGDLLKCRLNSTTEGKTIFADIIEELSSVFSLQFTEDINIVEYSLEYGFLRLSPAMRKNLNLTVLFVTLDPNEDECIGGRFHKFILDNFLGYDELLISSIRYLADKNNYKGYVRNIGKEIEYVFVNDNGWFRSYAIAALIMPLTVFAVSILLRFAHQQIFVVCTNLFDIVRARHRGHYNGSPLLTVILALFGMMAIITNFFHNSTLTLNITFIVWLADFYDSVCCRSLMAKRHWYRFFLLYHYVFYAYNNRYNGLHWQLNLWTSWLFTLHSMLFFFHHYELPYYLHSFLEFRETHFLQRRDPPRIPRVRSSYPLGTPVQSPTPSTIPRGSFLPLSAHLVPSPTAERRMTSSAMDVIERSIAERIVLHEILHARAEEGIIPAVPQSVVSFPSQPAQNESTEASEINQFVPANNMQEDLTEVSSQQSPSTLNEPQNNFIDQINSAATMPQDLTETDSQQSRSSHNDLIIHTKATRTPDVISEKIVKLEHPPVVRDNVPDLGTENVEPFPLEIDSQSCDSRVVKENMAESETANIEPSPLDSSFQSESNPCCMIRKRPHSKQHNEHAKDQS